MELKPGYKQTEAGVIPEDWGIDVIKNAYEIRNDLRLPLSENVRKKMQGPYPYYGPTKVQDYINEYRVEGEYCLIGEDGDHFLKWKDMPMTLLVRGKFNVNNHAHLVCGIRNETIWFHYYFKNRDITRHLTRQGAGRYKLTKGTLENIPLAIPPTKTEQTAIANALSDADALIQSLTRLIAKKRQIKQGAMQTLLNPYENGRLKAGWVVKKLGEIADPNIRWSFIGGPFGSNLKSSDYTKEGIRIIQLQNIGDGHFINDYSIYTSVMKADELISNNIYPGDIILSKMGDPVARACIIPDFHDRYLMCSDGIRLVADKNQCNNHFLFYYINSPNFRILAENASTGTTRKRIGLTELRNLEIKLPEITEQSQIAEILKAMDTEIAALEAKLAKYRHIKQGMMQNLLTGRIRLVKPESNTGAAA
jgi:type I restriction enzyme S subunit